MKRILVYSAFIRELQKIYARFVLTVLHSRMDRYHKQAHQSLKPYANDIKAPLFECINTLIDTAQEKPDALPAVDQAIRANATNPPTPEKYPAVDLPVVNQENVGELSKYFKARIKGPEAHPGIEEKLEHSTWEHIHAAIRCARQGDKRSAKMHANIASSACKELAHYMIEEQYRGFVAEIEQHLAGLTHTGYSANQGKR